MLSLQKRLQQEAAATLQKAMESGDAEVIQQAWEQFFESVVETAKNDYVEANGNQAVLASRGYRQLTTQEKSYYDKMIQAGKSENPKQTMTNLLSSEVMPNTIIEDVYKDLTEEHPLLARINFVNVQYLTRWILSDHNKQNATWGAINSEITEEITSGFKTININQCKLTAYTVIERDMLDLGPQFLDGYIRAFLKEALYVGLEKAIVTGSGHECPIGLDRDIHEGVSVNSSTGYPKKTAKAITSFSPAEYGAVLATMAETEGGFARKFDKVTLICNMKDYLTKVMPATTVLNNMGAYSNNIFPFPTETIISNELDDGSAIVCIPEEYFMGIGGAKDGVIEYSDEVKFLEDQRVFKIKMYGMGRAYDNTAAVLLDISNLDPAFITVKLSDPVVIPEAATDLSGQSEIPVA